MTRNMHLLKTKNPHFINARSSGMSETTLCCHRYMNDLCHSFDFCPVECELYQKIDKELRELKEVDE